MQKCLKSRRKLESSEAIRHPVSILRLDPADFAKAQVFYSSVGYFSLLLPTDLVISAQVDDRIIGLVRVARENEILVLRGMQIAPAFQRQGIGTRMLIEFEKHLDQTNRDGWTTGGDGSRYCLPHSWLEAFYAQIGFQKICENEAPSHLLERLNAYRKTYPQLIVMGRFASKNR